MKIFNKIIWSKKEPVNKNDIWFDGYTFRAYIEGSWEIIIQNNGGEPIDPETIEGFIPLMREFSNDFNNDFSR